MTDLNAVINAIASCRGWFRQATASEMQIEAKIKGANSYKILRMSVRVSDTERPDLVAMSLRAT